jgi:hypothetical protein
VIRSIHEPVFLLGHSYGGHCSSRPWKRWQQQAPGTSLRSRSSEICCQCRLASSKSCVARSYGHRSSPTRQRHLATCA